MQKGLVTKKDIERPLLGEQNPGLEFWSVWSKV